MRASLFLFAGFLLCAAACSKVPESAAAKKAGAQPRHVVDKATADVSKALQQGADARREPEEKK